MIDPVATRRVFTAALLAAAARAGQTPAATREAGVAAATAAVRAAMATAGRDAERPVYHFHPPAQWNNDPNGTIYWRGWHHLFYQLNPYGAEWGHMHWGHARSRNLVDWEHLPVALAPALERGEQHVFSGSAMEAADGRVRILYTSIGDREAEQWMAEPVDDELIAWKHAANNPVVRQSIHGARRVSEWRDPFVFRANGRIYMLCGGNLGALRRGGTGAVQIYEATNGHLDEWRDRGVLFEDRNGQTLNVECPNLVRAGAKWVLITSPHKPCEYFVGDIDWSRYRFVAESRDVLDAGTAYASNISHAADGRALLWLWGRTETDPQRGWNGCMTLVRELTLDADGFLRQRPAVEYEALRGQPITHSPADLGATPLVLPLRGDTLELQADITLGKANLIGLRARTGAGAARSIEARYERGGRLHLGPASPLLGVRDRVRLRLFVDRSVAELYADDGAAAIFQCFHCTPGANGVEVFAQGGAARLESATAWPLRAARFSLDRFSV